MPKGAKHVTPNEDLVAAFQVHGDRRALSRLIEQNLGLVWSVAKRYARRCTSLEVEDLVSEGCIGLMRAAETFDTSFGTRFSTHAMSWIRAMVGRASANDSTSMRLPQRTRVVHLVDGFARRVEGLVQEGLSREEAREKTQSEMELPKGVLADLESFGLAKWVQSLDAPRLEDGQGSLHDTTSAGEVDAEGRVDASLLLERVARIRVGLDAREVAILDGRILSDHRTLWDIGMEFGLSRERVRQVEALLIEKLQSILTVGTGEGRRLRRLRTGERVPEPLGLRSQGPPGRKRGKKPKLEARVPEPPHSEVSLRVVEEPKAVVSAPLPSKPEAHAAWVECILEGRARLEAVAARFDFATGDCFTCGKNVAPWERKAHVLTHDEALLKA
jgi:RNA polymerase primary sigma factor